MDDLLSVAADSGSQGRHTEYEIAALDIDYLVHYCGSSLNAIMHNALIRPKGDTHRWMAETSYSTTKRLHGIAERAPGWYRQFRESVLMLAITNIEPLCNPPLAVTQDLFNRAATTKTQTLQSQHRPNPFYQSTL